MSLIIADLTDRQLCSLQLFPGPWRPLQGMEWMIITHDDSNSDDLLDDDANSHKDSHDVPYSRRILIKPVEVQVGGRSVVSFSYFFKAIYSPSSLS